MLYVGIDPSYSKTGACFIDFNEKVITFKAISPDGTNANYADAVIRSAYIATEIIKEFSRTKPVSVIMEEPLITSLMASRLGILSGVIATTFVLLPMVQEIHTLNPNVVSSMNKASVKGKTPKGTKVNTKNISKDVGAKILEVFEKDLGFTPVILNDNLDKQGKPKKRVISHDEFEAFIIALKLLKHKDLIPPEVYKKIITIYSGFHKKHEVNPLRHIRKE